MSTFAPTFSNSDSIDESFAQIHYTLPTTMQRDIKFALLLSTFFITVNNSPDDAKSDFAWKRWRTTETVTSALLRTGCLHSFHTGIGNLLALFNFNDS